MFGSMSWQIPFADWAASSIKIAEKRSKSKKYKENNNNWIAKNIKKKYRHLVHGYLNYYDKLIANIQGPSQAIPAAKSEPNSCPSVAPAPTNPNNLEPDWLQAEKYKFFKKKISKYAYKSLLQHTNLTSHNINYACPSWRNRNKIK